MSKTYKITLLPGDGIGPEVIAESVKLLDALAEQSDFTFEYTEALAGGAAIDAKNDPMPQETIAACKASDAVLLGAVGGPKWDELTGAMRPYMLRNTDALQNLTEALLAVQMLPPAVYCVMHNKVLQFPGVEKDKERGTFVRRDG